MLPTEEDIPSHGCISCVEEHNNELKLTALDLINERREHATLRNAVYQQATVKCYNFRIKERRFCKGDLVLRNVIANTRNPKDEALGSNSERPLVLAKMLSNGAYRLSRQGGKLIPRTWNSEHLRPYFV